MGLIKSIGNDALFHVFMCLDDPIDLLNASLVSKSWYQHVITNGISKSLCKKLHPEIISIISNTTEQSSWIMTSDTKMEMQKREHSMYSYLLHCAVSNMEKEDCLLQPIGASSTDNYPRESILNTLNPNDHTSDGYSYWSSKGEVDPDVPECLTYRLKSKICIIDEIKIRPFKEFNQHYRPVYSAKFVRFRMGYSKMAQENIEDLGRQQRTGDDYVWTYTSPKFTMDERYFLQCFKLPRPVICTGGILQIEMLERARKMKRDGLYYICVSHVKAIGYMSSVFDLDKLDGTPTLEYYPDVLVRKISEMQKLEMQRKSNLQAFAMSMKQLQGIRKPHSSSSHNR